MKKSEIEIVKYPKIKHIKMLVNEIELVENHMHNDFEIFVVLNRVGVVKINSTSYNVKQGDIIFINSGDVHSLSCITPFKDNVDNPIFLLIQISNHFAREYFPQIQTSVFKSNNLKNVLSSQDYDLVLRLLTDAAIDYFSGRDFYQLDVISEVAKTLAILYRNLEHEIISESQKQKIKKKNNRLERIISYIDENFDTQIRLEDITARENISVTHFSHLFTAAFGMTFQEFISVKRMEQCIRLMPNKEKTLMEICYESGFSDLKYMNKVFIKKYGCTPKEYRMKYLNCSENVLESAGKLEHIFKDFDSLKAVKDFKNSLK